MNKSITPNQIKETNRNLIYGYIYRNSNSSQMDIAYHLHLSRPTVASNLTELENEGLIQKTGRINTEVAGRKPLAYSIVPDFRVSIGVEFLKKELNMIAVNLYGKQIDCLTCDIAYENTDHYFKTVCEKILEFKDSAGLRDDQILGIGFAIQGLISPDKRTVQYGKILSYTGLSIETFTKYLPYPCMFLHDAECAAVAEIWTSPALKDAFYLSLDWHFGAAIISNGKILGGKHGHSSTVEHIRIRPGGAPCYCGRRGCTETLCSMTALLSNEEKPKEFFEALHGRNPSIMDRWDRYLSDLAETINMLHLVFDTDFILGGTLAPYLRENDLTVLHDKIRQLTPFAEAQDFLLLSKMPWHNVITGAALPYIQKFLEELPG